MTLREDAAITAVSGLQLYTFGLWVALGMLLAVVLLALLLKKKKPGTAALQSVLSICFGLVLARLLYGLTDDTIGQRSPLWVLVRLDLGGYSLYGVLGGAILAAWLTARLTKQRFADCLDPVAPAFLIFVLCERLGEGSLGQVLEGFGWSRELIYDELPGTFLSITDGNAWYLATWRMEAMIAAVLFVLILVWTLKKRADRPPFICFMLLFGATQIIMESLRHDLHMTLISFVRVEQILSMVLLGVAVIILAVRNWDKRRALALAGLISIPLVTGIAIGIEFMIDRTAINRYLLYLCFIAVVAVPVVLGFRLLKEDRR